MPKSKLKDDFDFEDAMNELKKITEELEGRDVKIEDSMKKFQRGLSLAEKLRDKMKQLENDVEEIRLKFKDVLESEDKE